MKKFLEQVSLWGSIIGALLIALNIPISGWAFIPFLCSNIATIYLLKDSTAPKVVSWQLYFFIIINLIGIGRWLI